MRIRQTIKKAVALGTGALMLGATILGASAANVSDYPSAFVKDGKVTAKIVVGEKAAAIDVVGAIDIAADLQSKAVSKEAVATTGTGVSVTNGKDEEVALGAALAAFGTLDDADISTLIDDKLSWNDEELDVEETINVDGVEILTSENDEDFGKDFFLGTTAANAIQYRYVIDDTNLNTTCVNTDTVTGCDDTDTLDINFLGKSLEIQDVVSTTSVTVTVASEYFMNVGDTVTVEGKKVKLVKVGTDAVVVDVDGTIKTVSGTSSVTVNGIKVEIESVFDSDGTVDDSANLKIGNQITETIDDGDSMEMFGEPSREADAEWLWVISTDTDTVTLGADFNQYYDSDTEDVKSLGEKFNLPNDFASVYMASTTAEADVDITFEFQQGVSVDVNETGGDAAAGYLENKNALVISATDAVFRANISGTLEETDTMYLIANGTTDVWLAYENSDGDIQLAVAAANTNESFTIDYEDAEYTFAYVNNASNALLNMSGDFTAGAVENVGSGYIAFDADITARTFGGTDNEAVSGDITSSLTGLTATYDNPYLTTFGVQIETPEDELDQDTFKVTIPQEQVLVNVVVVGPSGSASAAAGSVTTDKVNAIGVDFGVLDKDFTAGSANSIVVGGPCVNTVAARLSGNLANCAEGFAEGEAKLAMFDDNGKIALLVAGYTGADTLSATRALVTEILPAKASAKVITTNIKNPTVV